MSLTFDELKEANLTRCNVSFNHDIYSWSVAEWTNALAGEAGEAANFGKKIIRKGTAFEELNDDELTESLGRELADVVIYADLVAQRIGKDLGQLVAETFNKKSEELGAPEKLNGNSCKEKE